MAEKTQKLSRTGGAGVGWLNITWPGAGLTVTQESLTLKFSFLATYVFSPDQIIAIEHSAWGIRIHHNVSTYPPKIFFWNLGDTETLIRQIAQVGFLAKAAPESAPSRTGLALRWQTIVIFIVAWNALALFDCRGTPGIGCRPGLGATFALAGSLIGCLGMCRLKWLQDLVLKPDRDINEIRVWLRFLVLLSGALLIVLVSQ